MTWSALLEGHAFDLGLLVEQFERGRASVRRDGEEFWLDSPSFDGLPDALAVQAVASRLLTEMNGAARLLVSSYRNVELRGSYSDGSGVHVVLTAPTMEVRARAGAGAVIVRDAQGNVVSESRASTRGPDSLELADRDPAVRDVMRLMADDHPDWFTLYKVMEVVESDAGGLGAFATRSEISAFGASANHPGASGDAARHARSKGDPPRHPMSLNQGRAFVSQIVGAWITSKSGAAGETTQ